MTKGRYVVCKMSMFVLSSGGGGGQKWVKFGPRRMPLCVKTVARKKTILKPKYIPSAIKLKSIL